MARVEELADRKEGEKSARWRPYHNLIPLAEIIAEARGVASANNKKVQELYNKILSKIGNELFILMDAPIKDIEKMAGDLIAEGVRRMRSGEVTIAAGYDGEYGKITLFSEEDRKRKEGQLSLF